MPPPPISHPSSWLIPRLDLRVDDIAHPGATIFFREIEIFPVFEEAIRTVLSSLYSYETAPTKIHVITLVLRDMPGVAHTHGSDTMKEIHFSLKHIARSSQRAKHEIIGVLTHELVHCYQYNGLGKTPGGLIEGIADWVRLKAGLQPPHWNEKNTGSKWDEGYEKTAFFLAYLEETGLLNIKRLNEAMKDREYNDNVFTEVTDHSIDSLWRKYQKHLGRWY